MYPIFNKRNKYVNDWHKDERKIHLSKIEYLLRILDVKAAAITSQKAQIFFNSVRSNLENMRSWVNDYAMVTERQRKALHNWTEAVEKWRLE